MLAHPIEKVPKAESLLLRHGGFVQRKYDGHRCLITRRDGEIYAYTRKGKVITTIGHVIADVDRWLPEGATLDGELYIHGRSLQSLSSLIKAKQPDSELLRYHWYDVMVDEPFDHRLDLMEHWVVSVQDPRIELVPTHAVRSMDEARRLFADFRAAGYEGAMLRLPIAGYEDAKRSDQLLKMKAWQDEEVTVIGCAPSKDGWAVLRCKRDSGEEFDTSAPGSVAEKTEVLNNFSKYMGRRLTVEYANLTADGLPFHCVALRWHEEI
jgi:DNA ligase-1